MCALPASSNPVQNRTRTKLKQYQYFFLLFSCDPCWRVTSRTKAISLPITFFASFFFRPSCFGHGRQYPRLGNKIDLHHLPNCVCPFVFISLAPRSSSSMKRDARGTARKRHPANSNNNKNQQKKIVEENEILYRK